MQKWITCADSKRTFSRCSSKHLKRNIKSELGPNNLLKVITGSFSANCLSTITAAYFLISVLLGFWFICSQSIAFCSVSSMFLAVMLPPLLAKLPRQIAHFYTNSTVLLFESNWARTSGMILLTWLTIWVSWDIFKISFKAEKIPNFSSLRCPWSSLWKSLKISSVYSLCF